MSIVILQPNLNMLITIHNRLGIQSPQCEEQLLKLDEQGLTHRYKIGIMYCKANQCSEEEMYNNRDSAPAFDEFLDTIGQRVRLKVILKFKL